MIVFLVLVYSLTSKASTEVCGQIQEVKGEVEVLREKPKSPDTRTSFRVSKVPFVLLCSDIVVTGPSSAARIQKGLAAMTLSSNTRLHIMSEGTKPQANFLELSYGKIRSFFKNRSSKSGFSLSTPVAVMGVRGTDFYASFDPNDFEMRQATLDGEVLVQHRQVASSAKVNSGQQAVARPTEAIKDLDKSISVPPNLVYAQRAEALKVSTLDEGTKIKIREASELAKNVKEFESPPAIQILGPTNKWVPVDPSEIPEDLKNLKNEF